MDISLAALFPSFLPAKNIDNKYQEHSNTRKLFSILEYVLPAIMELESRSYKGKDEMLLSTKLSC